MRRVALVLAVALVLGLGAFPVGPAIAQSPAPSAQAPGAPSKTTDVQPVMSGA